MDALRAEHPDLLVFDGGDVFQGSWPVNASKGRGAVEAFRLLGVDAGAVGNHEFDYGPALDGAGHPLRGALEAAAKDAPWAWLAANITDAEGTPWNPPGIAPHTIIERNGVRIGVFGLSTTETPQTTLKKHVEDLRFRDVVEVAREVIPVLEAQGAQVIVAVGHLAGACRPKGYLDVPADCDPDGEVGRLVDELPPGAIDVLVVGHAHSLLAHRLGETYVLEARSRGHLINRLDLVVGPQGPDLEASVIHPPWALRHPARDPGCEGDGAYDLSPLDVGGRTVTPSAEALRLVWELEAEVGSLCSPVGCSARPMVRARDAESELGNLVAEAMRAAMPSAEIALTNSGGLRADLPEGALRREHVHGVMPFENRLVLVELSGAQLELLFRIGTSGGHGILQLSGAQLHVDPKATAGDDLDGDGQIGKWEQRRLCEAQVGGAAIDPERRYRVVTTDFLLDGGDHLGIAFAGATTLEQGPLLREAIERYIATRPEGTCVADALTEVRPEAPRLKMAPCASP
jgi:5'-nucleotidase